MYTPDNHHHVVSIGGASFVPPIMTHLASLSPSSEASSSTSSPTHSRFSSSSSSATELDEYDAVQAHLAYARRMAHHTSHMWQMQRLAIEKAKLDGTYTGHMTSRHNGNARPVELKHADQSPGEKAHRKKRWTAVWAALFSSAEPADSARGRSRPST